MLTGRSGFCGGYQHGNEADTSVRFFADGILTAPQTITKMRLLRELRVETEGLLYDPADGKTAIAEHKKTYVFSKDGITLTQTLKWFRDVSISHAYLAMFPMAKFSASKLWQHRTIRGARLA
ncbi:MAG: hypothetical protein IJK02_05735 [Clostridia bacterium]|nr:hypothetical protein [Clostridia bacterium]